MTNRVAVGVSVFAHVVTCLFVAGVVVSQDIVGVVDRRWACNCNIFACIRLYCVGLNILSHVCIIVGVGVHWRTASIEVGVVNIRIRSAVIFGCCDIVHNWVAVLVTISLV